MRLFYDSQASRIFGEAMLLLTDVAAVASVVLFSTGALHRDAPFDDVALIALWAGLPRAAATVFDWLGRRRNFLGFYRGSLLFVLLTAFLVVAGWELLYVSAPAEMPVSQEVATSVLILWITGFFLFYPRVYRLHDVFLILTVFLALREAKPDAPAWLIVFCATFYFSSCLRHFLHDSLSPQAFPTSRARPDAPFPLNLQNVRVMAFLCLLASAIVFLGTYGLLHGGFGFPAYEAPSIVDVYRMRGSLNGDSDKRGMEAGEDPNGSNGKDQEKQNRANRQIGFRYSVALQDLTNASYDQREVLRVTPLSTSWRPPKKALWKAVSFARFDPESDEWVEEPRFEEKAWPKSGVIALNAFPIATSDTVIELRHRVVHPVCRNFVTPYFPVAIQSEGHSKYRLDSSGDLFPMPGVTTDSEYIATIVPAANRSGPRPPVPEPSPDYRLVPAPDDLGFDLHAMAAEIVPTNTDARGKVAAIAAYFGENFRYSNFAHWEGGDSPLRPFLQNERIGDCTYHATSVTLLLRAAGVSARLTVGFVGSAWDETTGEAVILNSNAHAWVEYFTPEDGWIPIDPVRWVPLDASFRRPPPTAVGSLLAPRPSHDEGTVDWEGEETEELEFGPDVETTDVRGRRLKDDAATLPLSEKAPAPKADDDEDFGQVISWLGMSEIVLKEVDNPENPGESPLRSQPFSGQRRNASTHPYNPSAEPLAVPENAVEKEKTFSWDTVRPALRVTLIVLGAVTLGFLLISFLRPGRRGEEDEEDELDEEGDEEFDLIRWLQSEDAGARFPGNEPRQRVLREYVRLQAALRKTRSHRRLHQTPLEHGYHFSGGNHQLQRSFTQMHRILYRTVYAREPVSDADADTVTRSCKAIRRALAARWKRAP